MNGSQSLEIPRLAELLDIGLWKYNVAESCLEWDTSVYRRYGVDPLDFPNPGDFWTKCLTEDSIARATVEMRAVLAGEKEYCNTYEVRLPTGEIRNVLARAT